MKTALVVDDHPITHLGCARLLRDNGYEEVFEAHDSNDAYRLTERHKPNLIVLDLGLPGVGGLKMIGPLIERHPDTRILVFSMNEGVVFAARALEAGAKGYLIKNSTPEDFSAAVQTLEAGKVFLQREMAMELAIMNTGGERNPLSSLSDRELQVLRLIGQGKSHQEIASDINVSYKTVANTASILKRKLGAKTLSDLIRLAIENEGP